MGGYFGPLSLLAILLGRMSSLTPVHPLILGSSTSLVINAAPRMTKESGESKVVRDGEGYWPLRSARAKDVVRINDTVDIYRGYRM